MIDTHQSKELYPVRCSCNRLLGKFNGVAETKCPKCKTIVLVQVNSSKEISTVVVESQKEE